MNAAQHMSGEEEVGELLMPWGFKNNLDSKIGKEGREGGGGGAGGGGGKKEEK